MGYIEKFDFSFLLCNVELKGRKYKKRPELPNFYT